VAVLLHGRLVDQPRFSAMLEGLDPAARDNVWHRITAIRRTQSLARAGPAARTAMAARSLGSASVKRSSGGGDKAGGASSHDEQGARAGDLAGSDGKSVAPAPQAVASAALQERAGS
jgi:hypothetical protein